MAIQRMALARVGSVRVGCGPDDKNKPLDFQSSWGNEFIRNRRERGFYSPQCCVFQVSGDRHLQVHYFVTYSPVA